MPIPIFHVNAEDPDAVVRVGRMALDYRYTFGSDVVIVDLIGYRRHGHSEVDDPTITQPLLYRKIKDHPPLWQIYAERHWRGRAACGEASRSKNWKRRRSGRIELEKKPAAARVAGILGCPTAADATTRATKWTRELRRKNLRRVRRSCLELSRGFHIHPKVKKLLEQRAEMGHGKRPVDYGMAEALAFGTLLKAGVPVRLTGQDTRRGTFNQRHAALVDIENGSRSTCRCEHLAQGQARCEIYNSTLSEAAVLGFEYGYSRDYPEALVLWEAQFGDFANGAQIIIDQFVSAGEDKWDLLSGVVLLLPHGYEGQGPEHSSARDRAFSAARGARQYSSLPAVELQRSIFTCCAGRRCARGASRWWCSRPRACCGIRTRLRRSRTFSGRDFERVVPDAGSRRPPRAS